MRAALPRERPHPAPLILLLSLTTSLLIHVWVSVVHINDQILSIIRAEIKAFILTRAERQLIPALLQHTHITECMHFLCTFLLHVFV